jgi:hypothetical protein
MLKAISPNVVDSYVAEETASPVFKRRKSLNRPIRRIKTIGQVSTFQETSLLMIVLYSVVERIFRYGSGSS